MSIVTYSTPDSEKPEGAHVPFLRAVRAHPIVIGIIVVLAIAVAVFLVHNRTLKYKATAQVLVTPVASSDPSFTGLPVVNDSATDPTLTMQTAASIFQTRAAATAAARTLGRGWTPLQVANGIDVLPQGQSNILSVTGTNGHAAGAARLANAYAASALSTHRTMLAASAQQIVSQLEAQRRALAPGDTSDAAAITQEIVQLRTVAAGHDPNFSLVQTAAVPGSATGTSAKLIIILAVLAGLVIGLAAALALEYLNRRVRDEEEILALYPLPVLARVPEVPRAGGRVTSIDLVPPQVREAYRTLLVQIPPSSGQPARTVMFTSPSMADGKTSSATNLALMLTAAGLDVALIDFDLRKPDLGDRLGEHTDIMEYFRSNTSLSDLLVPISTNPRLRVISSDPRGDVTPLLEAVTRRLPEILEDISGLVDYVIIDTAPLGRVSDALRIAPLVNDVVLVTRVGNTDRTELRHSRELLDRMGHTPTGMVILEHVSGDGEYGYGPAPRARRAGRRANRPLPPAEAADAPAMSPGGRERGD